MNNSYTWLLTWEDGDGSSELSKGGSSDNWIPREEDLTGEGRSTRYF